MTEAAQNRPVYDLTPLIDIDSPVLEAASITDKILYHIGDDTYTSWQLAEKACGGDRERITIEHKVKPFAEACQILSMRIKNIQKRFAKQARIFVSNGKLNYRYGIATDYKGQRPPAKPYWVEDLQQFLVDRYGAIRAADLQETDDCLAEAQVGDETCIVSQDKDLWTVPGWHYNYKKPDDGVMWVTELDAWKFFCKQMLMGDNADHIQGVAYCTEELVKKYKLPPAARTGCGPKTADKVIDGAETEWECVERVLEFYRGCYGDTQEAFMRITKAAQLLRMGWTI